RASEKTGSSENKRTRGLVRAVQRSAPKQWHRWPKEPDQRARRSDVFRISGGGSGIRTHDTVSRIHAFQACALSHSAIPPGLLRRGQYNAGRSGNKPAPCSRYLRQRRKRNRSIDPTHVARLTHVVAGEFAGAFTERRRADEFEQRL